MAPWEQAPRSNLRRFAAAPLFQQCAKECPTAWARSNLSSASKIVFYHHLRACATAGIPLSRAVDVAVEACEQESTLSARLALLGARLLGIPRPPGLAVSSSTLQAVAGALSGGELSKALGPQADEFPAWEIAIIRVGEKTGRLDQAFGFIEEVLERRRALLFALVVKSLGPSAAMMLIPWCVFAPLSVFAGVWVYLGTVAAAYAIALGPRLLSGGVAATYSGDSREFRKARFAQCLAWLVKAGVSVDESAALAEGAAGLPASGSAAPNETAAERLGRCGIFSHEELGSVRVGEAAGRLDEVLEVLANAARRQGERSN